MPPSKPKGNPFIEASLQGLEEMGHFPSDESRKRAIDEHIRAAGRGWDLLIGIVVLVGATLGTYLTLRYALGQILPVRTPGFVYDVLKFGGTIGVHLLVLRALHRWGAGEEMRRRLLNEGVPVCLKCGYLLRALPASTQRCPECGRALSDRARTLLAQPGAPAPEPARPAPE